MRRPTLDDQPALLALVHASDVAALGYPDYSPEDLREALTEANTDLARDCWVALDGDGTIVGWAYPSNATAGNREFIEVYVWPGRGGPAMRPLFELMLARVVERAAEFGHDTYDVRAGALPTETATLLRRTIRFGEKRAAKAMTPRVDVVGLKTTASVAELIAVARETGHTRFPVYENTIDLVIGVVGVPDALGVPPERRAATPVATIAREPVYVPESLSLDKVLAALREADADLAIVVDEYGGTDGVVTAEDLIEELVGEIADEYDVEPAQTSTEELTAPGGEKTFLVDGLLREDELMEQTGFTLPEGPYETLAGFLLSRLGHIPVVGESYEADGWEFSVMAVDRHRIEQVRVVPPPPEPADD
jgi:CBS domain containing-hemolysin-like protein